MTADAEFTTPQVQELLRQSDHEHRQSELEASALQCVAELARGVSFVLADVGRGRGMEALDDVLQMETIVMALDRILPQIIRGRVVGGQPRKVRAGMALAEATLAQHDAYLALYKDHGRRGEYDSDLSRAAMTADDLVGERLAAYRKAKA